MELAEKLINSNNYLDDILNKEVKVKIICLYNKKILLDSNHQLPQITILKKHLNNEKLLYEISNLLNTNIISIKPIPFNLYNNYNERYYFINIYLDNILNIKDNFSFNSLSTINSSKDQSIISNLLSR